MMLLEEMKSQGQTQILLLLQLVVARNGRTEDCEVAEDFDLPLTTIQQLQRLESDCLDRDVKGKLVRA